MPDNMALKNTFSMDSESNTSNRGGSGCYVSAVHGFILLLLAVAISVGVGILVHFSGGGELVCQCGESQTPTQSTEALRQMCIELVKNDTGQEICDVCPAQPERTTNTPAPEATTTATTIAPPATTAAAPTDYRLPITVRPYLYNVVLQPNIYGGDNGVFDFDGTVSVATVAEVAADTITLHAHPTLSIDKASIQVRDMNSTNSVPVQDTEYESLRHFFVMRLATSLTIGDHYEISMSFNGPLSQDGVGLYLSVYQEEGRNVYLATTQFEAPHARKAFPCFDEPALKAQFDITLVRQDGGERNYTSLSNTPHSSTIPRQNGMVADVFERTVVMPTYLLAFIVCDYEYVEDTVSGVQYRTWAMPKRLQYTESAQRHGVAIFKRFTDYFTPPYVFSKLDNIAIPDFNAGAMENWGLITYKETLLYEPGVSSGSDENWIAEVISHEIAHQWFGNLVSPMWWNWLWLNEAFASFWDYHVVGEIYPSWRKLDLHVAASIHGAMSVDSLRTSHPLTADVMTPGDISGIFDAITYSKGSGIIRMMHLVMGQAPFIRGLNRYLDAQQFGNAEHQDLWDALTEEATASGLGLNMTEVMDPWVTQMNFPVVKVSLTANNIVTFTQQRFLVSGAEDASQDVGTYGYKWAIPITFTVSDNINFTEEYAYDNIHYMNVNGDPLEVNVAVPSGGWIIVNIQECGFYRVNYDQQIWTNIIDYLSNNHEDIHPINRAQIINDAWNLAKAGLLDQSIALQTVNYLSRDLDYAPWRAFRRELDYVENMLERTPLYGMFQVFMNKTVATPYSSLETNITENMPPIDKIEIAQMVSLACNYDYQECVDTAVNNLDNWMAGQPNSMYPDLRSTYYCTAVRHGGLEQWEFVYEKYHTEQSSSEKNRLREALSCTRETWLLQRLLDMSVNASEVRPQDARATITYVADSPWGRDLAWNFVTYNYAHLTEVIQSVSGMGSLLREISVKFNTEQDYKKVQDFMNSGEDFSGAGSAFTQVLDSTRANIEWLKKNYVIFQNWLQSQTGN